MIKNIKDYVYICLLDCSVQVMIKNKKYYVYIYLLNKNMLYVINEKKVIGINSLYITF